ncbi:MAG: carboxypeptidase-like regulatory domain-containing protein [Acidobacteria bacterium]|nr:carboxypeptidase-like regulatory domain-containing protein [Acidobacteriota bacterium]
MQHTARKVRSLLYLLLLFFATAISAFAQTPTASIRGIVSDQSKALISGAKVTITNKNNGAERITLSNSAGEYQFSALQPGEYELKVTMSGFMTGLRPLTLQVGESLTVDFNLEVGQTTETVVVTSETPAINTTDYKVDGVVNRRQINNLPLNGRNFMQLSLLEPGVGVESIDNPGSSPNNFFRVSIAGASQAQTRISVDGATINDRVTGGTGQNFSQETVQEFQISTFNFDPSTSVTSVGSINVVSRSGSNQFHGSAFMYYRDHNMAAYPLLKRACGGLASDSPLCNNPEARKRLEDPFFARRQMGGSIGGPIKRDKLFFFFNGEYNNQDSLVLVNNNHPIWSKFDGPQPQPLTFKQTNIRFDYKVNDRNSAFLRFSTDNNRNINADGVSMPSYWLPTRNVSTQALGGLTSILSPKLVNDLRYSYSYYGGRLRIPTTEDCSDPIACIGLGGPQILMTTAPFFFIGNNVNVPQNRVLRTYQLTDTLSWQKSSHRLRFGGEWEHHYGVGSWAFLEPALYILYDPIHLLSLVAGTGGASSPVLPLYNALPSSLKLNATGTAPLSPAIPTYQELLRLPLYQFLTGIGDPGQPQSFRQQEAARNNRIRLFFTDQWRVTPNFTLNYGLTWSLETNILNHDLDRPQILASLLDGNLNPPQRDTNNFDPSLGFAWDVKGNGKMVIRGGAGIYHDSNLFWTRLNERAYVGPSGNGRSIIPSSFYGLDFSTPTALIGRILQNNVVTGTGLTAILPQLRAATLAQIGNGQDLSIRGVELFKTTGSQSFGGIFAPDTVTPYSINISAGIQHELASNLVVSTDFVMRRSLKFGGLHNSMIVDRNRFFSTSGPVIPRCTGAQAADPKANCSTGPIAVSHSGANYRYTGLHIKVDKRFNSSYLFVASYALSKYTGFNFVDTNSVLNLNNFYEGDDYQPAHRRHRFTLSGFADLPTYSGDNRIARGLLNGWQLGLIMPIISSRPLSNLIRDVDLDGDGINWAILPGGSFYGFGSRYGRSELQQFVEQFNSTLAGKTTSRGQPIPRITLPEGFDSGDTFFSQDLRLTRNIKLHEELQLQLIGEVFNLLNISNLDMYGFTLNAPNYGLPTRRAGGTFGTGVPRAFQFAARLTF